MGRKGTLPLKPQHRVFASETACPEANSTIYKAARHQPMTVAIALRSRQARHQEPMLRLWESSGCMTGNPEINYCNQAIALIDLKIDLLRELEIC